MSNHGYISYKKDHEEHEIGVASKMTKKYFPQVLKKKILIY